MAYHIEGKDVVIDGWDKGIADSPFEGIADARCVNLSSTPGQVSVAFKTAALNKPPTVSALAFSVEESDDLMTVASTSGWYNGMAIVLDSLVGGTGLSTGRVWWIGNLTATTFTMHKNPSQAISGTNQTNVTLDGTGTLSSYTLSKPLWDTTDFSGAGNIPRRKYQFILDSAGRAWWIANRGGTFSGNLIYLGNDNLTSASGNGLCAFKRYLFVFRDTTIDYLPLANLEDNIDLDGASGWVYGWESTDSATAHQAIAAQDEAMYYCNNGRIGSIVINPGSSFDPSTSSTYTKNVSALDLPAGDDPTYIAELGINLLIGGLRNYVYPWDRVSDSFNLPIILPEYRTYRILSTNSSAYILAGNRGRIQVTSGSAVEEWKKVPDHITGKIEPYFAWDAACIARGQLYFGITATENDGTAITGQGGVWAVDLNSKAIRHVHQLSYGSSGVLGVVMPNLIADPAAGSGIFAGWDSGSSTYGVDQGSSSPYTAGETKIDSEILPIGLFVEKATPTQFEFKLARPLVSGESVEVQYRTNLTESFTSIWTSSTVGTISDVNDTTVENIQWIQLRAILTSTASTPSRVPLYQVRMRRP